MSLQGARPQFVSVESLSLRCEVVLAGCSCVLSSASLQVGHHSWSERCNLLVRRHLPSLDASLGRFVDLDVDDYDCKERDVESERGREEGVHHILIDDAGAGHVWSGGGIPPAGDGEWDDGGSEMITEPIQQVAMRKLMSLRERLRL